MLTSGVLIQMHFPQVMQEIGIKPVIENSYGRFPSATTG
jgi:hypothetical protein